ncbi:hypothetical protein N658DRAFT_569839 [Parathielavia hyrcaniae]|uniref:Uncharacterized protein n=1 Tax=Parathielavia hyrcaniae TaxID=113614 RepID=A0AAN6PRP1_9PEZI|nr:hypothetical protein N658DRAFT_569839 [Parathielavia hyrcaniae]
MASGLPGAEVPDEVRSGDRGYLGFGIFSVSINVLGPASLSSEVATRLGSVSGYLQHPKKLAEGIEYQNPQFLRFQGDNTQMQHLVGIVGNLPLALRARASDELDRIMETLANVSCDYELPPCDELNTTLKRHQEDGVRFILTREDKDPPSDMEISSGQYYGGIIADVMGLGKTLTILTAILRTLPSARLSTTFSGGFDPHICDKVRTKSTLVVVPCVQLLASWVSQIEEHLAPGVLQTLIFHGPNRPSTPHSLTYYDLVLTTYTTLAANEKTSRLLYQLHWHRVVLDEGEPQLPLFLRWCLTGTPIQNKLGDLSSLAVFLRLPPASTKAAFEKQILAPLSQDGLGFAAPLRAYLQAFCLRRTEKYLEIPLRRNHVVALCLSKEERDTYTHVLEQARREIDAAVSRNKALRSTGLFATILRLRMLCSLGRMGDLPRLTSICSLCSIEDGSTFQVLLESMSICLDCGRSLLRSKSGNKPGSGLGGGTVSEALEAPRAVDQLSRVVRNILDSTSGTKHIVFSYWTSTLDALSQLLSQEKIDHRQIDRRVNDAERLSRLRAFKQDSAVNILVMSVETGSVGLNLAVANCVHMVEPQWNPAVEEQAVARVLRIGQTREVTVFRYVTTNTIEQSIVELQRSKSRLARFMFDTASDASTNIGLEVRNSNSLGKSEQKLTAVILRS